MSCANCGVENHEMASYCHHCGIQLAGIGPTEPVHGFNRIFSSAWLRSKANALPGVRAHVSSRLPAHTRWHG